MKRTIPPSLALCLAAAFASPVLAAPALQSGVAVDHIDPAVRVQDDLFTHLSGKWLNTTEIPADRSSWGTFSKLRADTQPQLRAIIESLASATDANSQKISAYYASFMDEARLESLGIAPLSDDLARIAGLTDKAAIPALMAHLAMRGVSSPFNIMVGQDAKDARQSVVNFTQGGLGMPDRDYYLLDDAKLADTRKAYLAHVSKMLTLAGDKDAGAKAQAIVALETELAKVQWSKVDNRDPVKLYNKVALAKLTELAPGFDWNSYVTGAKLNGKVDSVVVNQPSYVKGFAQLIDSTALATWQAYFQWHMIHAYAAYLPHAFVDEHFAFYGKVLTGTTEMRPRWKRGVDAVEEALGEALGQTYVKQYFPAERKARMDALVKNLMAAFGQSIDKLDWMGPATKLEAKAKLAKIRTKIGYPNQWRDYAGLSVAKDDLAGNVMHSRQFDFERDLGKLGKPVERDLWDISPQTVNAFYSAEMNEIVFPAAILQAPFFDMNADDAVNYGAIGGVIGHEISHGFDDEGSQYDGDGNLRDWWSKEDRARFGAKTKMLVAQYNAQSPIPGYTVNGELTLGENIADNSGLAVAYKAYKYSLKGKKAPVINNLTGDQRFFMGWSQVWREKVREAQQIVYLKSDPHSPGKVRSNVTLMNQPGFYAAFGVKEGDKMYLAPKARVTIW